MRQINLKLPEDWLDAIDAERGDTPRIEWIRELLRKSRQLKAYQLQQPPRRGEWRRQK